MSFWLVKIAFPLSKNEKVLFLLNKNEISCLYCFFVWDTYRKNINQGYKWLIWVKDNAEYLCFFLKFPNFYEWFIQKFRKIVILLTLILKIITIDKNIDNNSNYINENEVYVPKKNLSKRKKNSHKIDFLSSNIKIVFY